MAEWGKVNSHRVRTKVHVHKILLEEVKQQARECNLLPEDYMGEIIETFAATRRIEKLANLKIDSVTA